MLRFDRPLMGIPIICLALAGVISVATPPTVQAVPLPGFTGHADLSGFAIVNYAVLSPFDSFSGVLAGAYVPAQGNSGFDASKYTYLYQVANPLSLPLAQPGGLSNRKGGIHRRCQPLLSELSRREISGWIFLMAAPW